MMSDYRELAVWRIMSKNVNSWILVKNLWNISLFSYYCMPSSLMICTVSLLKNNIISSLWVLARLFTEDECNIKLVRRIVCTIIVHTSYQKNMNKDMGFIIAVVKCWRSLSNQLSFCDATNDFRTEKQETLWPRHILEHTLWSCLQEVKKSVKYPAQTILIS